MSSDSNPEEKKQSPLKEITQPFVDLMHAPRALWGINLGYVFEGMVYFGMLGYLAIHFSEFIFQGVEHSDEWSHNMVMILTAGITISMFFLGVLADKWGVRRALILAFILLIGGRTLMSGAPNLFEPPRPAVRAGDRITLEVGRIEERDHNRAIIESKLLSRTAGSSGDVQQLAIDLAEGNGTAPGEQHEARLVKITNAKVTDGKDKQWTVKYGQGSVVATMQVYSEKHKALCKGAVFSLNRAYVHQIDKSSYVVRTHWNDDFSRIDTSACAAKDRERIAKLEKPDEEGNKFLAEPKKLSAAGSAKGTPATLAELRALEAPPADNGVWLSMFGNQGGRVVDRVVKDAVVTYVRNGGYFIQTQRDGPAIAVFLDPRWTQLHWLTMLGILLIVIGYGMYQPAAYSAVRQFTTPKTAAMGFAMLYALMNLGGWLPTFAFLLRDKEFAGLGISGTFWVYTSFTVLALFCTVVILSRNTVRKAMERVKEETARIKAEGGDDKGASDTEGHAGETAKETARPASDHVPGHMWIFIVIVMIAIYFKISAPLSFYVMAGVAVAWTILALVLTGSRRWLAAHPLADTKFFFFIFALIPVQTLFTYNWLVLPQYINRAFEGWIGEYFEIAANANPILIFILVPMITAFSQKAKVYNMMIYGTFVMAAPAFLLVAGPQPWALMAYILIMTIGEAMWQPRFLQYAAEIAPEGRTGEYMGVAQLPWFLTKFLVPLLYSGWMVDRYCPAQGQLNTETMWLIFGLIAIASPIMLIVAKGWVGKDFKTKA